MQKILFVVETNPINTIGGAEIQILKTKEYLEKLYGLKIKICTYYEEETLSSFDPEIVHIFKFVKTEEILKFISLSKKHGRKVVLSPIFWDFSHSSLITKVWNIAGGISINDINLAEIFIKIMEYRELRRYIVALYKSLFKAYAYKIKRKNLHPIILKEVDLVLPNSEEEALILRRLFGTDFKYKVVYNAVDDTFVRSGKLIRHVKNNQIKLLTVGRIEPLKNQYNVIRAISLLKNMGYENLSYTMVGKIMDYNYMSSISRIAKRANIALNVIPHIEHELLHSIYAQHSVHILPSFRESPGLASLEALACGCFVIISNHEFVPVQTYFHEYLDNLVYLCDPYDPKSIADSIEKVIRLIGKSDNVYTDIPIPFTWEKSAEQTYNAYIHCYKNQ